MLSLTAALLALGSWLGSIVFQSAIVAPAVFGSLDADGAGKVLRTLFPRFFRLGIACGVVALIGIALAAGTPNRTLLLALVGAMLLANVVALAIVPAINAARDAGESGARRFRQLHGLSVGLTLGVMLSIIAVVALIVAGLTEAGS